MRWWPRSWWGRVAVLAAAVFLVLLVGFWYLTTAAFWQWLGWRLVAAVQDRLNAELRVGEVHGNLVTGMVFRDIRLIRGEEILSLAELEVSLSPGSLLRLEPVLGTLAFRQLRLTLVQDAAGNWNVAGLLKKRPPPPFNRLHLRRIAVDQGTIRLRRPGSDQLLQDVALRLNLTITSPGRPEMQVQAHELEVAGTWLPYPRLSLTGALTLSQQALELPQLQIRLGGVETAQLSGQVSNVAEKPTLDLKLALANLRGEQLQKLYPPWPEDLGLEGNFSLSGSLDNLQLAGCGALNQTSWLLKAGWQQEGSYRLSLDFRDLTPGISRKFATLLPTEKTWPPLHGHLELAGTTKNWPAGPQRLVLTLEPWTYQKFQSTMTRLEITLDGPKQQQATLTLKGNFGNLAAEARGRLWPWPGAQSLSEGYLSLKVRELRPSLLIPETSADGWEGELAGEFRLPAGQWRQGVFNGRLTARGRWREYSIRDLSWQGSWQEQRLQLQPLQLRLDQGQVTGTGWLDRHGAELTVALNLQMPLPAPGLRAVSRGRLQGTMALAGAWSGMQYRLDLGGNDLRWTTGQVRRLQLQAEGRWQSDQPLPNQLHLTAEQLTTPGGPWTKITATGQGTGRSLAFTLASQRSETQSGSLQGQLAAAGDAWVLQLQEGHWPLLDQEVRLSQPGLLRFSPRGLEKIGMQLRWGAAAIELQGQALTTALAATVRINGLPLAQMARLLPGKPPQGRLDLNAALTGTPIEPQIKADLNLSQVSWAAMAMNTLTVSGTYERRHFVLNADLEEKPGGIKLSLRSRLPLHLQLWPWRWHLPAEPLQARLTSERLDWALLPALVPQVSQAAGPAVVDLQLGGTWERPELSGALKWQESTLTIRPSGALLHISPGELRLTGDRLQLPPLLIFSGDGSATLQGGARLQGLRPQEAAFTLKLADALLIDRQGSQAAASGQAELTGTWPALRLQGRITAAGGHFRLAFFRPEKRTDIVLLPRSCELPPANEKGWDSELSRNFTLALSIDIPGGVWLRDKDLQAEVTGKITINRQPGQPLYLGGALQAVKGTVILANKPFALEKAQLLFPGEPRKPAVLEARASRLVDEVTLALVASGPLSNLRTRIESNPPLPPRDLLSLLVFERVSGKMTREEYLTVSQKAMGLIGGLTMERLKNLLGGAFPFLGELTPASSQEGVGVGKKVGKDITISYERKLNPLQGEDINQLRLNYRLHKYFSAETQIGRRNSGGDLFFNLDF